MNKKKSINTLDSGSLENLLFSGLLYRIISEPDGIRGTVIDMFAFLDASTPHNLNGKIQQIDSAMQTIDKIKDKDGAFTAFETLMQGSRYNLVIVDEDYQYIFHNEKSKPILSQLFCLQDKNSLRAELILKIKKAKSQLRNTPEIFITIPEIINNQTDAYLLTNKHNSKNDRDLNILFIPDIENHQFQIQNKLVNKYNLTNKEELVLTNLIGGCDTQQISEQFCISYNTVRSHLKSIFRKTNTKSQADLIRLFLNDQSHLIGSYFESKKTNNLTEISHDLFITLSTKNRLCYREYGPKNGNPLIIFHNVLGSRYNIPYDCEQILEKSDQRVIIPDRPGYGYSDSVDNYNEKWNGMFDEFVDYLELTKFDLLGNVFGCSQVLHYLETVPDKVNRAIFTSPTFINSSTQRPLFGEVMHACSRLTAFSKKTAYETYRLWMKSMKYDPGTYVKNMVNHYSGSAEREAIKDEQFINRLTLNYVESQRNKSKGSAEDAVFSVSPRNIDLEKITTPIDIWIGDEDSCISLDGALEICDPLPNKTFHIRKGYGEDIFYHLFEEIIQ